MVAFYERACQRGLCTLSLRSASHRLIFRAAPHTRHLCQSQAPRASASTEQTAKLRQDLLKALEDGKQTVRTGKPTPEVEAIVEQLRASAGESPIELRRDWVDGVFHSLLNTTSYLDPDACSTLGTLTFQQFHPRDLKVRVSHTEMYSGVEAADQYQTNTFFEVLEGEAAGLLGIQSAIGTYEVDADKTGRQVVSFTAVRFAPVDKSPEVLSKWLATFKDSNPSMGDDGVAMIHFPQRAKGTRDFILLDEEVQVTVGNRGSVVIVKRKESL